MSKANLIQLGIILSSVMIGASGSLMIFKKVIEQKESSRADKEVADVVSAFNRYKKRIEPEPVKDDPIVATDPVAEPEIGIKAPPPESQRPYQDYSGKKHLLNRVSQQMMNIEIITEDETDALVADGYEEDLWIYFLEDDVAVDQNDEIVIDRANHVGDSIVQLKARWNDQGEDRVLVANHDTRFLYEIALDLRKYKDVIGDM